MIVVEYEFIKNSKGITSQFRAYYKGKVVKPIYRSELADNPRYPVISEPVEGMTFGWAIKPDFEKETAIMFGPYKWDYSKKDWEKIDKKEVMSWLVAIRQKGGKKYED